jgi:hypothetical protein
MKEEVLKQTWSLLKAQIKNSVSFDSARKKTFKIEIWKLFKKVEKQDRKKSNLVMTFSRSSSSSWLFTKQDNGLSVAHNPTHLTVGRNSVSEAFNSHWFFIKTNLFFCFYLKSRRKMAINKWKKFYKSNIHQNKYFRLSGDVAIVLRAFPKMIYLLSPF